MSRYEYLIKQYDAITQTLDHQFPNTGLLEHLEDQIEELEEEFDLSHN